LFVLPVPEGNLLRLFFGRVLPGLLIPYIKDRGSDYGKTLKHGLRDPAAPEQGKKRVVVEFSSPNIIEEFKAPNLRSTLLGAFIANLYESMGWDVVRLNYLGDWGNNIGLFAVGWSKYGCADKMDDYRHLAEVFAKINEELKAEQEAIKEKKKKEKKQQNGHASPELNATCLEAEREEQTKKLEDRDPEIIKLWTTSRKVSIDHYTRVYGRLNVTFDEYSGESQVQPETMAEIEEILKRKGLCEDRDGSIIIDMAKYEGTGFGSIRRHGTSTYLLRDLGAAVDRFRKYEFDKMIYVVSHDQEAHFRKVQKVLGLMDEEFPGLAKKLEPVFFSRVAKAFQALAAGKGLDDILDATETSMNESLAKNGDQAALLGSSPDLAAKMGVNALFARALQAKITHDPNFDKMTDFESAPVTGPFMQYVQARTLGVLRQGHDDELAGLDMSTLSLEGRKRRMTPCPFTELLRVLIQYPVITATDYENLESAPIMACLQNVTVALRNCLDEGVGEDAAVFTAAERAILDAGRQVLENGMKLLGMTTST
jgi:arginyl-tRNA synthetase